MADFGAATTTAEAQPLQEILEETNIGERVSKTLVLLKKELVSTKLQAEIGKQVEEQIAKSQRRFYLMEQLKSIKKELGLEVFWFSWSFIVLQHM